MVFCIYSEAISQCCFQIQVMKDDQDNFKDTAFNTSVRGRVPPLVTTKCVLRDDG